MAGRSWRETGPVSTDASSRVQEEHGPAVAGSFGRTGNLSRTMRGVERLVDVVSPGVDRRLDGDKRLSARRSGGGGCAA